MSCFRPKNLLLVVGLAFLILSLFVKVYFSRQALTFSELPPLSPPSLSVPERIMIDRLKINLPVKPAEIRNGLWQISPDSASYLVGSGSVGQPGNLVIYAHNKNHLFGPIRWIRSGDEIIIGTQDSQYTYSVVKTALVSPDRVDILAPSPDPTLTLYTCTGFLDRFRFVVTAEILDELPQNSLE